MSASRRLDMPDPGNEFVDAEALGDGQNLGALRRVALLLERINLAEWVAIMNSPRRSFWVNFWAGLARGMGMVVGAMLMGGLMAFFSVGLLKKAFVRAGGVPWVGAEMREAIAFVLRVVREYQGKP